MPCHGWQWLHGHETLRLLDSGIECQPEPSPGFAMLPPVTAAGHHSLALLGALGLVGTFKFHIWQMSAKGWSQKEISMQAMLRVAHTKGFAGHSWQGPTCVVECHSTCSGTTK
jgi:hypothetical protein